MANKAYNFNNAIYLIVDNDCFKIEQSGDPESSAFVGTISPSDVIPPDSYEIPAGDVVVIAALENVADFCDSLIAKIV